MILHLPSPRRAELIYALRDAGTREIGGILMGEHVGVDEFRVERVTIQRRGGTLARFIRIVTDAVSALTQFFQETKHDFTRFNYLGEWHSHPLFAPYPSAEDHRSMMEILLDDRVGANFVVLMVAKLVDDEFVASATLYTKTGLSEVALVFE